jgi:hypothetical protein
MKMLNRSLEKFFILLFVAIAVMMIPVNALHVSAAGFDASFLSSGHSGTDVIDDSDRQAAYNYLIQYKNNIINVNNPSQDIRDRLETVWNAANTAIANDSQMTAAGLISYVGETISNFDAVIGDQINVSNTEDFLFINNNSLVTTATYGQYTYLTLSLINVGKVDVTDVVLTPQESTDINKWPFEITTASNALVIPKIQASSDIHTAHTLAQNVTWVFLVSKEAKTGTYPLVFDVIYYRGGAAEKTTITTYIHINGAPGAGSLSESNDKNDKVSTPRIIVTGFKTDPEVVYAGDTFKLTISIQNTSLATTVSNIQFDLAAAKEGNNNETTYEAFLPTSGSATIFVPAISPGATTNISIEMTARSDLMQKPYVIALSAAYEDNERNPYTMSSNISIPVKQEARIDTGEYEILPDAIDVGNQTNIMFPVYNKGKTTLYNVQVDFIADSVEGGSTFLGKLEPGATGNVDAMVTGIAPTMDDGIIIARVSYEDEAGNVSYIEKEIKLFVMEAYVPEDDWGYDDGFYGEDGMYEEEQGGVHWKPIVITIVILAIVGIVAWRLIVKKRKAKKMLDSFDDDDFE